MSAAVDGPMTPLASIPIRKERPVRPYTMILRLSVSAALVLASLVAGGWKWDSLPWH
jgi:hypothetical protein